MLPGGFHLGTVLTIGLDIADLLTGLFTVGLAVMAGLFSGPLEDTTDTLVFVLEPAPGLDAAAVFVATITINHKIKISRIFLKICCNVKMNKRRCCLQIHTCLSRTNLPYPEIFT